MYYMIHIFWLYKTLNYDLNSDPNLEKSQVRNPIRMILNEPFQDYEIVIVGTCVVEAIKSDSPGL